MTICGGRVPAICRDTFNSIQCEEEGMDFVKFVLKDNIFVSRKSGFRYQKVWQGKLVEKCRTKAVHWDIDDGSDLSCREIPGSAAS